MRNYCLATWKHVGPIRHRVRVWKFQSDFAILYVYQYL